MNRPCNAYSADGSDFLHIKEKGGFSLPKESFVMLCYVYLYVYVYCNLK